MISAILMAAGYSRRMKTNKLLLKYRGKTLIEHTIDAVLKCHFSEIILVARDKEIIEIGTKGGLKVIQNNNADRGISESIKLGVTFADDCDGYMFFTVDQPLLNTGMIQQLLEIFDQDKKYIIVPQYKGKRGSPVLFPKEFKQDLMNLEGDIGGKVVINKNLDQVRFIEVQDQSCLFDVDKQEDYKKLLQLDGAQDDL